MFVKFSCGCVGLEGVQGVEEGSTLLVKACDGESSEDIGLHPRTMMEDIHPRDGGGERKKLSTPLSSEEASRLVQEMSRLIMGGHRLREVRSLLAP